MDLIEEYSRQVIRFADFILFYVLDNPVQVVSHILFSLFVFALMVLVHEIAHALTLHHYVKEKIPLHYKKGTITVGTQEQIDKLNPRQYFLVLFSGIFFGFYILLMFGDYFTDFGFMLMFFSYIYTSRSDIRQMMNLNNKNKSEKSFIKKT